jgi:hypothetical protein
MVVVAANPLGDFPLFDDWAFGWSVKVLLEEGTFRLSDWISINLLPQVVWGALFCLPFGFSFTALRISTLVAGLAGVIATAAILREIGISRRLTLFCAAIVAVNPLYFGLSNSFNSDVPSFALYTLALYSMTRWVARRSPGAMILGVALALLAVLQRQSNLVLLPAIGAAYVAAAGVRVRTLAAAIVPTLIGLAAQLGYSRWLTVTERKPLLYGLQIDALVATLAAGPAGWLSTCSWNGLVILLYCGLFLLPITFRAFSAYLQTQNARSQVTVIGCLLVVGIVGLILLDDHRMPLILTVLDRVGIGPWGRSTVMRCCSVHLRGNSLTGCGRA